MNTNIIPVLGWAISLFFNASMAIPFWLIWTKLGIGARYFYQLPEVYQALPFWHCVGLFIVIGILKTVLVPQIASVSQTNKEESK